MKPRRTHYSNAVFTLQGGTEDNDLWVYRDTANDGCPLLRSCWVPTGEERQMIADGANIELIIWGNQQPPVAVALTNAPLGLPLKD